MLKWLTHERKTRSSSVTFDQICNCQGQEPIKLLFQVCPLFHFSIRCFTFLPGISMIITPCMKLPAFAIQTAGNYFMPWFQASFLARNQTIRISVILLLQNGWKLSQFALRDEIYNLNTNTDYQELGSSTSEEVGKAPLQLNQVFSPHDHLNIMDH